MKIHYVIIAVCVALAASQYVHFLANLVLNRVGG